MLLSLLLLLSPLSLTASLYEKEGHCEELGFDKSTLHCSSCQALEPLQLEGSTPIRNNYAFFTQRCRILLQTWLLIAVAVALMTPHRNLWAMPSNERWALCVY
jgi:hypothetical protein